ncbi:MAG: flagellar biosynthesis anti-sigma factor FlgM [Proteobacteria bacterium]|nr:flagellar biosynthesis anti-sigma factor FlgM [Pseudomonadota bacterium]
MKINDKIINYEISKHLSQSAQPATEAQGEKQLSENKKVSATDQSGQDAIVNLSPALKEAQIIKEVIASEPDVREEKVAQLKQQIESGRYQVDHMAVADKLVDSFLDEIF